MGLLRLRFAAGVCVLAAGLLMGGGAVAVADPGASDSATNSTDNQQPSTGKKNPKDEPGATTSGTGGNAPGQQPKKPKDKPGATTSRTGATTSTTGAATSTTGAATSTTGAATSTTGAATSTTGAATSTTGAATSTTGAATSTTGAATSTTGAATSTTGAATSTTGAATSTTGAATSTTGATTSTTGATTSTTGATTSTTGATTSTTGATTDGTGATVTDVVAAVPSLAASVTNAVAPVPNLVGPVSDVNALIQDMLTSVAGAVVPVTQLQSELAFFLFGITGVEPVVDAGGRIDSDAMSAAVHAWVASELPRLQAFAGIPGMPVADIATGVAPLGGIAASISAAMTQVGEASSLPALAQSFFRAASSELLLTGTGSLSGPAAPSGVAGLTILDATVVLPISLAALAALALPGAGGLTILTAAGVGVGYRQAKAGSAVRTAGIARFAGPGPLGVVRSGSLIVVRPRALRVARPRALSAECLLDKVA